MNYPCEAKARTFLKKYILPKEVMEHSEEVSENCVIIGTQILKGGTELDLELLKISGLLHDIGRWKYCREKGYCSDQDIHEYETGRLLKELGYVDFGDMLQRHLLCGATPEEVIMLGYPREIEMTQETLEIKIVSIADSIRPRDGICTLDQKIEQYRTSKRLHERYFKKMPGLLENTIERFKATWQELISLGMEDPPIKIYRNL